MLVRNIVSELTSNPHFPRINEAVEFEDHKIQVASHLISLKVEPSPALSVNLSSEPLIKIMLTHHLVRGHHCYTFDTSLIWLRKTFLGEHTLCSDATYLQNLLQKELWVEVIILNCPEQQHRVSVIVLYCVIHGWLMFWENGVQSFSFFTFTASFDDRPIKHLWRLKQTLCHSFINNINIIVCNSPGQLI